MQTVACGLAGDRYATNIARAFDWESKPRLDVPNLPTPEHVVSRPCAIGEVPAQSDPQRIAERALIGHLGGSEGEQAAKCCCHATACVLGLY